MTTTLKAWTSRASDADVGTLLTTTEGLGVDRVWCFVEGPTRSDLVDLPKVADLAKLVSHAWHVRAFSAKCELLARRSDFDGDRPWLVRFIGPEEPLAKNPAWEAHDLKRGTEQALMLYGVAVEDGTFVEGEQFRDAFRYPHVGTDTPGARASLVAEVHACSKGLPIVRWKELRSTAYKRPLSTATAARTP
ncbi:MAG: hypothetical protein H6716_24015 [Polyangiaceae bacterium]|nr:hypothetical protein [Polyangiaceae bacterium]